MWVFCKCSCFSMTQFSILCVVFVPIFRTNNIRRLVAGDITGIMLVSKAIYISICTRVDYCQTKLHAPALLLEILHFKTFQSSTYRQTQFLRVHSFQCSFHWCNIFFCTLYYYFIFQCDQYSDKYARANTHTHL